MAKDYPYMMSNNKIGPVLQKIISAAKTQKLSYDFLKKLGFTSTNDRAIIPLLKRLGFINDEGAPTEYYDRLKDKTTHPFVLGERIRDFYSDLFSINTDIHKYKTCLEQKFYNSNHNFLFYVIIYQEIEYLGEKPCHQQNK